MFGRLVLMGGSGLLALGVATAPVAQARSLQDIHQQMVVLNSDKPCRPNPDAEAFATCKASITSKLKLAAEAAPIVHALPAPSMSPASYGQADLIVMSEYVDDWAAAGCDGDPRTAVFNSECTGEKLESIFDDLTNTVGMMTQGGR